ncbi:hypothetical protein CesoFtcFv8_003927 [Champsocephalus esox]|uniref:Uncharacterized protein n=1 Tax=Champsocephalus esox TaxID=159716 RepID=A0AAN8HC11_9TELE|nr:hypothetical protein CesoFtcFv8_003927 [Champsocephalus esox]
MTSVESSLHQELQLLKHEYHKGFLLVHDAIESLRQIGDIKSRFNKEKLQKDIRHVCRGPEEELQCSCCIYTEAVVLKFDSMPVS